MKYVTIKKISKDLNIRYGIQELNMETLSELALSFYAHYSNMLIPNETTCCVDSMNDCLLEVELPCNFIDVLEVKSSVYGRLIKGDIGCLSNACGPRYNIEQGVIKTNFNEGKISFKYSYIPIDDDGFIKIPDDQNLINALVSYIAWRLMPALVLKKTVDKNQMAMISEFYNYDMTRFLGWLKRVKRGDLEKMALVTNTYLKPTINGSGKKLTHYINDGYDAIHFQTKN